jgi:2-keto-4-pentenoate hydratase/2-oxohepta-3-ene-1,7-dioic acid hydratase in catechol pathway
MRIAAINHRAHLLLDSSAVDLELASKGRFSSDLMEAIANVAEIAEFAATTELVGTAFDESALTCPVPRPSQVVAIGVNYADHAAEMGIDLAPEPVVFTKFPTCIVGPNDVVTLPSDTVDWEVEMVLVMGRDAFRLTEEEAWDAVAFVTVGQDLSDRDLQFAAGRQFALGKSRPGFGPIGPWLVTPDSLPNRDDLELTCSVNGEVVQDGRTSSMIRPVPTLLAEVTQYLALRQGDVIFTGTPAGAGMGRHPQRYLKPEETLVSTIEGIGTITTTFVDGR